MVSYEIIKVDSMVDLPFKPNEIIARTDGSVVFVTRDKISRWDGVNLHLVREIEILDLDSLNTSYGIVEIQLFGFIDNDKLNITEHELRQVIPSEKDFRAIASINEIEILNTSLHNNTSDSVYIYGTLSFMTVMINAFVGEDENGYPLWQIIDSYEWSNEVGLTVDINSLRAIQPLDHH
jgi:hypothetical protein